MLGNALTSAGWLAAIAVALAGGAAEKSPPIQHGNGACIETCRSKAEEKATACIGATCKASCQDGESKACDDCATRCVESVRSQLAKCTRSCGGP